MLWLTRKELEIELLRRLRQEWTSLDLRDLTVYDLGAGEWTIGHIRLGRTKRVSVSTIAEIERQVAREIQLLPGFNLKHGEN